MTSKESPGSAHYARGAEEFRKGDAAAAEASFRTAVEVDPRHHRAWAYLAMAQAQLGKNDEAIESYRKCIDVEPGYHKAYNNIGELYRRKGLLDYASMVFKMATELAPTQAHYFFNLGITYAEIGMFAQAEEALRKAVDLDGTDVEYALELSQVLFTRRRYDDAKGVLETLLARAPDHDRSAEIRARVQMLHRRSEAAKSLSAGEQPPAGDPE